MIRFTIDWTEVNTDRIFTTDYVYDGCGCQKGYDLIGWSLHCLEFGRQQGFRGKIPILVNPDDYPEFADMLYQKIDKDNNQIVED